MEYVCNAASYTEEASLRTREELHGTGLISSGLRAFVHTIDVLLAEICYRNKIRACMPQVVNIA